MQFRTATDVDVGLLARFNRQLIEDEGHRNRMSVAELEDRMRTWLHHDYDAILFDVEAVPVAYALYRRDGDSISLRHFFVAREHRRAGIGRRAMDVLLQQIWPPRSRIRVEVLVTNHRAYAFWTAMGFQDYALTLEMRRNGDGT